MSEQFTDLETGVAILYGTFLNYAASGEGDDDPTTISKKELSKMMAEQLPHLTGKSEVDKIMEMLDQDQDGTMNFMEYCNLITALSMMINSVISASK